MKTIMGAAMVAALLAGALGLAPVAQAAYIVSVAQVGTNVVATGSGSLNLDALSFNPNTSVAQQFIAANSGLIGLGSIPPQSNVAYTGFTGPTTFGPGRGVAASSGTGNLVEIYGGGDDLFVPQGYASGSSLGTSTATFDGETFSSLGLTPGYEWTWGSGATADSFTLNIGAVVATPEPGSLLLVALPLGLVILLAAQHCRTRRNA